MGIMRRVWGAASAITLSMLVAGCHPKGGSSEPYTGPAHVFTPRTHPPRARVQAPPQPLAELAPVIDRIDACAAEPEPEEPAEPQGGVTSVVSMDQAKNIPVGGQSRDFTSVVDLSPTASADASGIRLAGTSGVSLAPPHVEAPKVHVDSGWGEAVYLSNDDTMSLSAAQRILYAIDRDLPIDPRLLRPHEFLNYFSFESAPVAPGDDFSVLPSLAPRSGSPGSVDLALAIQGRTIDRAARRNANLALVVDRSGSMREEGRMNYLKRGLRRMVDELKRGDVVHLVVFNERVCVPLEGFVVGRDAPALLERAIDALVADG
ncbi:MAG: hypothetical protein KC486_33925, partial [Myxococcales bacterium]|nr:hypothetical protein [Myxococcales bacterium]